ncbi:hypothetical protein EV126DRAFT_94390 [Verticillium dahliae]|nr:hypothetical protein EV126DRAFT_94390 [Verticillium dahliae]
MAPYSSILQTATRAGWSQPINKTVRWNRPGGRPAASDQGSFRSTCKSSRSSNLVARPPVSLCASTPCNTVKFPHLHQTGQITHPDVSPEQPVHPPFGSCSDLSLRCPACSRLPPSPPLPRSCPSWIFPTGCLSRFLHMQSTVRGKGREGSRRAAHRTQVKATLSDSHPPRSPGHRAPWPSSTILHDSWARDAPPDELRKWGSARVQKAALHLRTASMNCELAWRGCDVCGARPFLTFGQSVFLFE